MDGTGSKQAYWMQLGHKQADVFKGEDDTSHLTESTSECHVAPGHCVIEPRV